MPEMHEADRAGRRLRGGAPHRTARGKLAGVLAALGRAMLLALAVGGLNALGDALGGVADSSWGIVPGQFFLPALVLGAVLGTMWAWALTAFAAGYLARRPVLGMACGVVALLTATSIYYAVEASRSGRAFDLGTAVYWWQVAIPGGAGLGLLGAAYSRPGRWWATAAAPVLWYLLPPGEPASSITGAWVTGAAWVVGAALAGHALARLLLPQRWVFPARLRGTAEKPAQVQART
ncbi:hypothetical protein [Arsenicicoccus dermatophilus]|uniref:hypothetical protein n=1 Tax=Arsenicicoccus dermatophilus TaxID=1076331 RepID=UPI0039174ACC